MQNLILLVKIKKEPLKFWGFRKIANKGKLLTNDKPKDVIKVVRSLGKRAISLKGATWNISQKGGSLNFQQELLYH